MTRIYKTILLDTPLNNTDKINEASKEGWELVCVIQTNEGFCAYLKRETINIKDFKKLMPNEFRRKG
jgi:thioredoxin-related protein